MAIDEKEKQIRHQRAQKKYSLANPQKIRDMQNRRNKVYPQGLRQRTWKKAGIKNRDGSLFTWQDYLNLLKLQNSQCSICDSFDPGAQSWHVDHNHETGIVRGILCSRCNHMLGLAKDNVATLAKAIQYLKGTTNHGN